MTRSYTVITIVIMVISTISTYFMLAPGEAVLPGLGLASMGLALKMVVIGFLSVNFIMWWFARKNNWDYSPSHQLIGIAIFMSLGFAVYLATNMIISESVHVIIRACIAGTTYIGIAFLLLWRIPWLIGMNKSELIRPFQDFKRLLLSGAYRFK